MKLTIGWLSVLLFIVGCGGAPQRPVSPEPTPEQPPAEVTPPAPTCNEQQGAISREADERAAPYSLSQHLAKNFADGKVSWLMKDSAYQSFVVKTGATKWGRCNDTGCYVFVAPSAVIHSAVEKSMKDGKHDPAAIGQALGLPAANFEGPLRLMTLDLDEVPSCIRLPVDSDPGVWACKTPEDKDCFKFGGYTSGGIPEAMVIDAPVEKTNIAEVQ